MEELTWDKLGIVKVTNRDRSLARMILSGLVKEESNKLTRGFLYYQVVEGDYLDNEEYERFIELGKNYLYTNWPNVDWDKSIEGKNLDDLSWDPHLEAYKLFKMAKKRIVK